jgi:hypothetical protein
VLPEGQEWAAALTGERSPAVTRPSVVVGWFDVPNCCSWSYISSAAFWSSALYSWRSFQVQNRAEWLTEPRFHLP